MPPPSRGTRRNAPRANEDRTKPESPQLEVRSSSSSTTSSRRSVAEDSNNNNRARNMSTSSGKTTRPRYSSKTTLDRVAELREKVMETTSRLGETLEQSAAVARKIRHPLTNNVIIALDAFKEMQAAMCELNEALFTDPHDVREDQACIIHPEVLESMQEDYVKKLLLAVGMEESSVVATFRDRRRDFLVIRFSSKVFVHEFLRRFRERNLFKLLGGARLTRDMKHEELEKYWRAVEQVAALNRSVSGDRSFYVDLVTLEVCQKEDSPDSRPLTKAKAKNSVQDTVSCDLTEYGGRENVEVSRPQNKGNYYDDGNEINLLRKEDATAKRLQKNRLGKDSVNVKKRVALERMSNPAETFDAMLLLFKEQRLWLNSVREICYNCHLVCHVEALVQMAVTLAKDDGYAWKMYAAKLGKVIFLKNANTTLQVTTETNQECCFKDAITSSRTNRSGLSHRIISTQVVAMPVYPLDLLIFGDEDCVAEEKRDNEDAFVLLKVRPEKNPFDEDFYRNTAPSWYFRALLSGIDKIVVGLAKEDNRVYETVSMAREDLGAKAVGWVPSVCVHFLNDVLMKVKTTLDAAPDLKTFVVERKKGAANVVIERDAEARRFLPPPFVGAILKMNS